MKKTYLLLFCLLTQLYCAAQPAFDWVDGILGADKTGITNGNSMATDSAGNVYITGHFDGNVDFDPGPAVLSHSTPATVDDCFILKLDPSGNLAWAKFIDGSSGFCMSNCIAVDAAGNSFVTGVYNGTFDFDPGPGVYSLTGASGNNAFLFKLDPSGNFIFAKTMYGGSADYSSGSSLAVDAADNIYLIGDFSGTVDFDPAAATTFTMTSVSGTCLYISKLDPSGNFLWAEQAQSNTSAVTGNSITLDTAGNIIIAGNFNGSADFDPGAGVYTLSAAPGAVDLFIQKLDNAGHFIWTMPIPCDGDVYSVRTDAAGNIYLAGYFSQTVDFDPGPGTAILSTGASTVTNVYVLKLDTAGTFGWVGNCAGGSSEACSLAMDGAGNIYVTGSFKGTVDFDPGPGTYNLSSTIPTGNDIFSMKLNAGTGSFAWAAAMDGLSSPSGTGYAIAADASSNVYTYGKFRGTADFDPGPGTAPLTAIGVQSMFIQKMHKGISNGIAESKDGNPVTIYPNPAADLVIITNLPQPASITVYDVTGRVIHSQKCNSESLQLDLHAQAAGIYFVTVRTATGSTTNKIIKQ